MEKISHSGLFSPVVMSDKRKRANEPFGTIASLMELFGDD